MRSKIEAATTWMENLAADNSHGYAWGGWGPQDYDCGHAIITAWEQAGVPVKSSGGASYTGDMRRAFLNCGAAYRGATDGQSLSRLWFRSSKPQVLPPFSTSCEVRMTDVRILANIPEGFAKGYIDGGSGDYVLTPRRLPDCTRTASPTAWRGM